MNPFSEVRTAEDDGLQFLWEDSERVFCRDRRPDADGTSRPVLLVLPSAERAIAANLDRLAHEYELKDELEEAWAVRPLELAREGGRPMLGPKSPGGGPWGGRPARLSTWEASCASRSASPRLWASSTGGASSTRTSSRAISSSTRRPRRRGSTGSASPRACRAHGSHLSRRSFWRARSPTWRLHRP